MSRKEERDKVYGWLKDLPKAELCIHTIGREMVDAEVIWEGMPIQMSPDEVVESYKVPLPVAKFLIQKKLLQPVIYFKQYCQTVGQASMYRQNFVLVKEV